MVTNELCFLICLTVFLFGVACGIVVGIKAEDKQRQNERAMQKMCDEVNESEVQGE